MVSLPLANLILVSFVLFFNLLTISVAEIPGCNPADQAVLFQIKDEMRVSEWPEEADCCNWEGINCIIDGPNGGRVNGIGVPVLGSGVDGQIPEVIGNLSCLQSIGFTNRPKLRGPLPKSLKKLKHLDVIYLSNNALTGNIHAFFGQLKRLSIVDISSNRFTGDIPDTLSNLTKLTSFNVSHNIFTGSIPSFQAKSLTSFDASFNQLCGPIPAVLSNFSESSFVKNKCLCGSPLPPCK